MRHTTFDTLVRRAAGLQMGDRRAFLGGLSAVLPALVGWPLAAEAKRPGQKKRKKCKKRIKDCRQDVLPDCENVPELGPNCEEIVNKCCKKACESVDKAFDCLADSLPPT
jgi:hypothetical protein